jgi:hypothetical protein
MVWSASSLASASLTGQEKISFLGSARRSAEFICLFPGRLAVAHWITGVFADMIRGIDSGMLVDDRTGKA